MSHTDMLRSAITPWQGQITRAAAELARAGWAEAGAGNISIRLERETPRHAVLCEPPDSPERNERPITESSPAADKPGPFALPYPAPALAGATLLVSVAGSRMREIARDPVPHFGLLAINPDGLTGHWYGSVPPTSELASHIACHDTLVRRSGGDRCLLHAHPTALIALTGMVTDCRAIETLLAPAGPGHEPLSGGLNRQGRQEETEGKLPGTPVRPELTSPLPAGSVELARASAAVISRTPVVIWPGHGILAAGDSLDRTLDLVQLADKAAAVALAGRTRRNRKTGRRINHRDTERAEVDSSQKAKRTDGRPGRSLQGRPAPEGIETRYEVRTRDSKLSPAEFGRLPRRPVTVVLDNIRSAFNVGSIFRLADACRCARVITCGYTAHPPHHKLEQTALGATAFVPWHSVPDTLSALEELRKQGLQLVAVETATRAVPYHRFEYRLPVALVFGNEALGISEPALAACDRVIELPVAGFKNSINVAAAAGIVLYDLCRAQGWL